MFADIVLPLNLSPLTYGVPFELEGQIKVGCRVTVQLGKRKLYAGIIIKIHSNKPQGYEVKDILSIIDEDPLVSAHQIQLWQWMADYYMCTLGEVMSASLPSGLKMESETKLMFCKQPDDYSTLNDAERVVLAQLENKIGQTVEALARVVGKKNILSTIQQLQNKGLVDADEWLKASYKPKVEVYVRLSSSINSEERLNDILLSLKRAKKQETLLLHYLSFTHSIDFSLPPFISKKDLLREKPELQSVLKACVDKGILVQESVEVARLSASTENIESIAELTETQLAVFNQIKNLFAAKDVVLLHGITSSGKTEIYFQLIKEQLDQGKQVLYLLPEIALTFQLINRLRNIFGDRVGVSHSRYSDAERVEVFRSLGKRYDIIIGARSSVFLPFTSLGLIIVDEEHDGSYKQQDPAPRYNARDTAVVLASIHSAKVILGTATPSIESYYNAQTGKYGLVRLKERFGNAVLPVIETVNMLTARKKQRVTNHFSQQLLEEIEECLKNKEQVILFQNRRGFSPFIQCNDCGYIPQCIQCNVSLTYHKQSNQLRCHYCGYSQPMPNSCSSCGSTNIETKGFGTEKAEEELSYIFKDAHIRRLDLDSVRSKNAYEEVIALFESGDTDILVGTQMVTKGLDFDKVSLVGILNADNMLNFPDFRVHERSFQLLTQVCGRAGRREKQGKAIIQTTNPSHPIIRYVVQGDYERMYKEQIEERKLFFYPPFYRLINTTLKHKDISVVNSAAKELARLMRLKFGKRVLGPESPLINKIQNRYISVILLKLERNTNLYDAKKLLQNCIATVLSDSRFKSLSIVPDVDLY
ncbi:MAG: primosomal protein N' [Prevotellaceae bacterium]|jgi:primosomal protein N' (replication factor Y)|nr:primosomal protein N' [Prevotellaceae bacterium]